MLTAKVTSKGQITIPKQVRDKLGVQPGEGIGFEEKDGIITIKKALKKSPFDTWVGKLKKLKGKNSDTVINELRGNDNSGRYEYPS